jgi:hypothetical protein
VKSRRNHPLKPGLPANHPLLGLGLDNAQELYKKWFISVYLMEKSWENYGLWHVYGLYIIIYLYLMEKSWNIVGKIMGDPLLHQKFNPENHPYLVES